MSGAKRFSVIHSIYLYIGLFVYGLPDYLSFCVCYLFLCLERVAIYFSINAFFFICRSIRLYLFVFLLVLLIIYLCDRISLFTLVPIYQSVYLSAHHIYIHTCVHQSIYLSVHHIYVHKSVKPGAPVRTHASKRYSEPRPNAIACD